MKPNFRLSLVLILSAFALIPSHAFADDVSDAPGPCLNQDSSLVGDMSQKVATPAQIAAAVALASDPGNIVLDADPSKGLTQEQLDTLYSRADHFQDLAEQTVGTPDSQSFGQAASEIRATQTAQDTGDEYDFKYHLENIFKIFGNSWKFMLQPGPLVAIGIGAAGYAATHGSLSERTSAYFNNPKHTWTGLDYEVGNYVGQGVLLIPWVAVGALTDNTKMNETTDQILGGGITNLILTEGLKYAVNQPRPNGASRGFPSGHASFSFLISTGVCENYGWKACALATGIAAYVGMSRIGGAMHTPAQVIAGAAIGTASEMAAHDAWSSEHTFTVAPGVVNGAPGIVFTKTLNSN